MGRLRFSPFLCLVSLPKFKFIDSEFIFVLHWFFFLLFIVYFGLIMVVCMFYIVFFD